LDYSDAAVQDEDEIPAPPPFEVLFVDARGNLLPPRDRDDRHLSPEEKAKNPLVFPKWAQFLACLAREGFAVREEALANPGATRYAEVTALWEQARAEGPSTITQDAGKFDLQLTDAAASYVACHMETIGLP
jgi:hypothetical protein